MNLEEAKQKGCPERVLKKFRIAEIENISDSKVIPIIWQYEGRLFWKDVEKKLDNYIEMLATEPIDNRFEILDL